MGVTLATVGLIVFCAMSGQKASAQQPSDADDTGGALAVGEAGEGSSSTLAVREVEKEAAKKFNYEDLLRAMMMCAVHAAGPKVTKGMKAKRALESRVAAMGFKARKFMVAEFKSIAGTVLKELQAEEAMLLLDWDQAVKNSYPSISVLMAGTASPVVLAISFYFHMIQIIVMFVPLVFLSAWAIYADRNSVCAIPTIYFWIVSQAVLCFVLIFAHGVSAYSVQKGGRELLQKAAASQKAVQQVRRNEGELTASDLQRAFIHNSTLLQHGLVVEDRLRRSAAFTVVGMGTFLWIILTLWTFVLTVGWTVFPGMVAFHPKAAGVAPADEFCSALATVFTARLSCVLAFLFILINLIQLLQFVSFRLVDNRGYRHAMLSTARTIDKKTAGLPVVELVVRSLLLRGASDTLDSQLVEAAQEQREAERELARKRAELAGVEARLEACRSTAGGLRKAVALDQGSSAALQDAQLLSDMAEERAKEQAEALAARAQEMSAQSQEQLDALLQKLMDLMSQLRVQDMVESAQHMAEEYAEKAQRAAHDLQDSDAVRQGLEKAKGLGQEAVAKASKVAEDVMQSEEFQKRAAKAQEMSKEAVAKASKVAGDVMQSEEFQKAAAKAQDVSKEAVAKASKVAEDVRQSEEFQTAAAKAQEGASAASSAAQGAKEEVARATRDANKNVFGQP